MKRLESIKERFKNEEYIKRDIDYYEAHEDIEYLLQRLERYDKALKDIGDIPVHPLQSKIAINCIIEDALKE